MRVVKFLLLGVAMCGLATVAGAQDTKAYKEGAVTQLTYVKVKPGKFDAYMKYLAGDYKKLMEAYIKAGLVIRYGVYSSRAKHPGEPNVILTVTSANYAALDKVDERDAISSKLMGNADARAKAAAERESLRDILGGELIQEMALK